MKSAVAPIVLFVYNRLDHIKQTVEALQKNELASESKLYIYSDAATNSKVEKSVEDVRKFLKTIQGFKNITIIEQKENFGLAKSIITGVTDINLRSYDTGWINRSDWTNVHLGSNTTKNVDLKKKW